MIAATIIYLILVIISVICYIYKERFTGGGGEIWLNLTFLGVCPAISSIILSERYIKPEDFNQTVSGIGTAVLAFVLMFLLFGLSFRLSEGKKTLLLASFSHMLMIGLFLLVFYISKVTA